MKKLTLNVDELAVESFDTASLPARDQGTVQGFGMSWSCDSICPTVTDWGRCCPP